MSTAHILIIDDDPAILTALPETLRLWIPGLLVDICGSARLALDRIESKDYDAIISDIRLPDMDGLALLERIRALRPTTPTLLVTGYGDQTLAMRALRGGAFDYILKPIDRDYLLSSLTRALQHRQLTREAEHVKQAQTTVTGTQESLQTFIEAMPCLLVVTDQEDRIVMFNRAAEEVTGYPRSEMLGHSIFETLMPPSGAPNAAESPFGVQATRSPRPYPCLTKHRETRLIEWRCATLAWQGSSTPCTLCVGIDLTDQHRTGRELRAVEQDAATATPGPRRGRSS